MPPTQESQRNQLQGARTRLENLSTQLEPTIEANRLEESVSRIEVPEPEQPSIPNRINTTARNVARNTDGLIQADTEARKQRDELMNTLGSVGGESTLQELFREEERTAREDLGLTPESMQELQDIQLQLNDMDTESALTETRIESSPGQTLATAQREVTQEQRENAVRQAGLAARAATIQGNIQTANQMAKDAVDIAYQDRQLRSQNLINQIDRLQGQVDSATAQLLEQDKRQYEQELLETQQLKENIQNAIVNGATQAEVATLTDASVPDDEKLTLAQQITARGVGQMRDLEMQNITSQITNRQGSEVADVSLPAEYESIVEQAASLAGASDQRETTKAIISNALANEDYVTAYSQISNNVEEGLTGGVKTRFANARTDIRVMEGMKQAIEEYVAAGGDTNILKGKAEDIASKFGVLANSDDPEFAALGAQLQREFQTYRNIMTGAAFSPEESADYARVNPTTDKSLDLNLAIMEGATNQLENRIISTIESRVPGAGDIYEKAVTGGAETLETSWDEVEQLPVGEQFMINGVLYEKVGEDDYVDIK